MSAVSSLHRVKLIVCGLGNVGGAFINQIRAPAKQKLDAGKPLHLLLLPEKKRMQPHLPGSRHLGFAEKYGIAPEIFALVDSSGGLLRQQASASVDEAKGTAAADFVTDALKWKSGDASAAGGRRSLHDFYVAQASGQGSSMRFVPKLEDCVKLAAASVAEDRAAGKSSSFVMIDISATDATCSALVAALQQGGGVVLANKKPLSVDQQVFDALTHPSAAGRVGYESTVGAGTPFIATLQRLVAGGDDVRARGLETSVCARACGCLFLVLKFRALAIHFFFFFFLRALFSSSEVWKSSVPSFFPPLILLRRCRRFRARSAARSAF